MLPSGKKVCIIDDEKDIREIYSVKFSGAGFEVIEAENGQEGLEKIRTEKPDIILLDLQMPVKNGLDVLEELSKDETISSIPVIILSNADSDEAIKTVGQFDTKFYLIKALVTPEKIVSFVREVLN